VKFGPIIARRLQRYRSRPSDRWHLDEMVVRIAGKRMYLWSGGRPRGRDPRCAGSTQARQALRPQSDSQAAEKTRFRAKGGDNPISCAPTALPSTTSGWRPTMNRSFARTIGPKLAPGGMMTRAQDAALQIGSICPTLSQCAFRPVQQLQRSALSRLPVDAADLQSGSHGAVAERYCRGMSRLCSSFRLS
jgi:hypothetical protein